MTTVVEEYRAAVEATPLEVPEVPVVGNIGARPLNTIDEIRDELAGQLTQPVRWTDSVQWMAEDGVDLFLEVGPKDVLRKLVQRIVPAVEAISVGSVEAVARLSPALRARGS
jgi:[acyl-carrier-protein] S-malonyltransferase